MPRRIARRRNPATQCAKAGVWLVCAWLLSAKLTLAPKTPAIRARRLMVDAEVSNRQNRGMRHCSRHARTNNRSRAIRRDACADVDDAGACAARPVVLFLRPFELWVAATPR